MPKLLWILSIIFVARLAAQEFTIRVEVPVVNIDVVVRDDHGRPVGSLLARDFEVLEDGVPQPITHFSPLSAPYSVLLLFDVSGSTRHQWDLMKRAAVGLDAELKPGDRLAIGTFDEDFRMVRGWTAKRTEAGSLRFPDESRARRTQFYRSMDRALKNGFRGVTGRRALIVLSDGRDDALWQQVAKMGQFAPKVSEPGVNAMLRTASKSGIPIFVVALNTDLNMDLNPEADAYVFLRRLYPNTAVPDEFLKQVRARLEKLAEVSGGRVVYPRSLEDILRTYQEVGREIGSAYSLGYAPGDAGAPIRKIEVRPRNGSLHVSQSRTTYRSPAAQIGER